MSGQPSEQEIDRHFSEVMSLIKRKEFGAALQLCRDCVENWNYGDRITVTVHIIDGGCRPD